MGNPLRSEEEAFRWVLVIGAGAATVIALALLVRPSIAVVWAAALVGFAAGAAYRGRRGSRGAGAYRLLAVSDREVRKGPLLDELEARARGRDCEILLLVLWPDGSSPQGSAPDEASEQVRQRMELSLIAISEAGLRVRGEVAGSGPEEALEEALAAFPADEVVSATDPPLPPPRQGAGPPRAGDGPRLTIVRTAPAAPVAPR